MFGHRQFPAKFRAFQATDVRCTDGSVVAEGRRSLKDWSMPNCFQCGRYFQSGDFQLRRNVRTGEHITKRYRSGKINVVSVRYGKRIVCKECARQIDRENRRAHFAPYFGLLALLGFLITFFVVQQIIAAIEKPPIDSGVEDDFNTQFP